MRYLALATDYDGTLAHMGKVLPEVLDALKRFRSSGRKLAMVTGRRLDDLFSVYADSDLFDVIVAENGALLYFPLEKKQLLLADPPPAELVEGLHRRKVPFVLGEIIIATWEPHHGAVLEAIREAELEHQIIFNKSNVMILPPGITKASGVKVALESMGIDCLAAVGVGDAENDHALLSTCGLGAAVANALPALKREADLVLTQQRGAGVIELIDHILATDTQSC